MNEIGIAFLVLLIFGVIIAGIAIHQDYREKHPKASH